jgi:cell division protein FtsQ
VYENIMRRILKILSWIGIAAWFVVILGFVSGEADQVLCNRIDVVISDTVQNKFVTDADIRTMLRSEGLKLQGYPLKEINTRELERLLEKNPYIRGAEVSTDVTGRMEIDLEQSVPLVRIMPEGREGFYLDTEGKVLPLSKKFVPYVLLVSGYINTSDMGESAEGQIGEIYDFCSYLVNHPLWRDQIVQIYVNRKGEYELIPRVGAHQILMGSLDQWENKLEKLELLYQQGLSTYGWNNYNTINLKYTNQIICTKR